jgi:sarcosine oxidase
VSQFDVVVVGLGAVGSSALFALAASGARVIGIDRFNPPHALGSSHGETRITRQAIGEGQAYVPLVVRSNEILDVLGSELGKPLIERCGFLLIARNDATTSCHGKPGFLATTLAAAEKFAIPHECLTSSEVVARFRQFAGLDGDEEAYYEPGGGYVRPEQTIAALLSGAKARGAIIKTGTQVLSIVREGSGFRIKATDFDVMAQSVIVATGAWVSELSPCVAAPIIRICRQALHWFPVTDFSLYRLGLSPTFYWTHGATSADQFYGFPPIDGHVKVAAEQYTDTWDPNDLSREVSAPEQLQMSEVHIAGRLAGVAALPTRSKACLYSVSPDFDFVLGEEGHPDFHVVSACSGHGFKHAPAVGEAIAMKALGVKATLDTSSFSPNRF